MSNQYIVSLKDEMFLFEIEGEGRVGRQFLTEDGFAVREIAEALVDSAHGELLSVWDSPLIEFSAELSEREAKRLERHPMVSIVEPDYFLANEAFSWGIDRIDDETLPLDGTYVSAQTGAGVHVYIIDTGIRATHQEFTGRIGTGYSPIGFPDENDSDGHGTHVAGIIAGSTVGVARQAIIHPVKVLESDADITVTGGSATVTKVINGLDWVRLSHASPAVVNIGLSGPPHTLLDAAVQSLIDSGVSVVVAAGNKASAAANYSPGRVADAITVGATGFAQYWNPSTPTLSAADEFGGYQYRNNLSQIILNRYSNTGPTIDILAPGTYITSASISSNSSYTTKDGTCMSAAHVTGAVALFLEVNPFASPAQVRQYIVNNAKQPYITSKPLNTTNRLLFVDPVPSLVPVTSPVDTKIYVNPSTGVAYLGWYNTSAATTGFVVYKSSDLISWSETHLPANQYTYSDQVTGLSFYRVAAKSTTSLSAYAYPATVSQIPSGGTLVNPPSAPGVVSASPQYYYNPYTGLMLNSITLQWQDTSSNETGFKVEYRVGSGTWYTLATKGANATSHVWSGASNCQSYQYRVKAFNADGDSAYGNGSSNFCQTQPPVY